MQGVPVAETMIHVIDVNHEADGDGRMKTAEASTDNTCEKTGRVWIWVEEAIPTFVEKTLKDIKLTVVNELIDATILQSTGAELVTRKASQQYSKYLWQAVPGKRTGEFVVQGDLRADESRHVERE